MLALYAPARLSLSHVVSTHTSALRLRTDAAISGSSFDMAEHTVLLKTLHAVSPC